MYLELVLLFLFLLVEGSDYAQLLGNVGPLLIDFYLLYLVLALRVANFKWVCLFVLLE